MVSIKSDISSVDFENDTNSLLALIFPLNYSYRIKEDFLEDLVAYFDGKFMPKSEIKLNIENLGFTRGYGAYECFRTYGRVPFHLDKHIKRLKNTCENLCLEFPKEDFYKITETLLEKNPNTDLIVRVHVVDHSEKDSYQLSLLCSTPEFHFATMPSPYHLKSTIDNRENHFKSTSYSAGIIATRKAKHLGFNDVLFIGEDNLVHELSRANIFAVKDQTLYTPVDHCLKGITRSTVLEIASGNGMQTHEENFSLDFLSGVDEVFATATIRGLTPIAKIDDLEFSSHKMCEQLQSLFVNSTPFSGFAEKL